MSEMAVCDPESMEQASDFWECYRSRPRVLARWLYESRANWKMKYFRVKNQVKCLKVRVADIHKSREHWKQEAQRRSQELAAMKAELDQLRNQMACCDETPKKKAR